jgi:hypothetical protein
MPAHYVPVFKHGPDVGGTILAGRIDECKQPKWTSLLTEIQ